MRNVIWASLVLISLGGVLGARAQEPPGLPPNAAWVNFGQRWAATNEVARLWYLTGFIDGSADAYGKAFEEVFRVPGRTFGQVSDQLEPVRLATHPLYTAEVLSPVITDLYRDPANTFITHAAMVYIARDKLDGKDVEPLLRDARVQKRAYVVPNRP